MTNKRVQHNKKIDITLDSFLIYALFALLPIERLAVMELGGFTLRPVYIIMGAILIIWPIKTRIRASYIAICIGIAAAIIMSTAFSLFPKQSLPYAAWALFTIAFSTVFASRLSRAPELYEKAVDAYLYSAAFWSLTAITQWLLAFKNPGLAYSYIGGIPRVQTLTLEPSYLATYLLPPLFIALFQERRILTALIMFALLCSTSRTGIVALLVGMAIFIVIKYKHVLWQARKRALYIVVLMLVILYPFVHVRQYMQTMGTFFVGGIMLTDKTSAIPRIQSWREAYMVFTARPLLGVGVGAYGNAALQLGLANIEEKRAKEHKTTNLYTEVAAEMGIIGLMALAVWIMFPILIHWRKPIYRPSIGILIGYLVLVVTFPLIQTWWRPYIWIPWILAVSYGHRR